MEYFHIILLVLFLFLFIYNNYFILLLLYLLNNEYLYRNNCLYFFFFFWWWWNLWNLFGLLVGEWNRCFWIGLLGCLLGNIFMLIIDHITM